MFSLTDISSGSVCSRFSLMALFGAAALLSALAEGTLHAQQDSGDAKAEKPAIKVGSKTISQEAFQKEVEQTIQKFKKRMPKGSGKGKRMEKMVRNRLKRRKVRQLLLEHHAEKSEISVSDEEVEKKWNEYKKKAGSEKRLKQALKQQGRSSDPRKNLKSVLRIQKFVEKHVDEEQDVAEKEVKAFFEKNKKKRYKGKKYENVKGKIRSQLQQQKRNEQFRKLINKLKEKTDVQTNL